MKKVLVIGGSGFIGSELIKKLSNYHVINFSRPGLNLAIRFLLRVPSVT